MEKFCWWGGTVSFSAIIAVLIAKAQTHPSIWYGWILNDAHVIPALIAIAIAFWLTALGQHDPIKRVYWRIFSFLFRPQPSAPVRLVNPGGVAPNFEDQGRGYEFQSAFYGAPHHTPFDVTEKIKELIRSGRTSIPVNWKLLTEFDKDPIPYVLKSLVLNFSTTYSDGKEVFLPVPGTPKLASYSSPSFLPELEGTRLAEAAIAPQWKGMAESAQNELKIAQAENLRLLEELSTVLSKLKALESKAERKDQLTKELLRNAPRLFVEYEFLESPIKADVLRLRNDKDDAARSVTFAEINALVKHRIVPLAAIQPVIGGGPQVECIVTCHSGIFGDDRPLYQILSENSRNAVETVHIYYCDGKGNTFAREFRLKQEMRRVVWEPGPISVVRSSALEAL